MLLTYQAFYLTLRFGQVGHLAQDALVNDGPIPHLLLFMVESNQIVAKQGHFPKIRTLMLCFCLYF